MAFFRTFKPKKVKMCPGCPPKDFDVITGPQLVMSAPERHSQKKVTVVDMNKYKKTYKENKVTSLF